MKEEIDWKSLGEIHGDNFVIVFDFKIDDLFLMEIKSKGCILGILVKIKNEIEIKIDFYDSVRFKQEIDYELDCSNFFYEENIVVIKEVTIEEIVVAVENIVSKKIYERMIFCD